MKIKKLQNDQNQSVLLIVHDENGQAHDIIESLCILLQDLVSPDLPYCSECGGEGSITTPIPSTEEFVDIPCSLCNGTGIPNLLERYGLEK